LAHILIGEPVRPVWPEYALVQSARQLSLCHARFLSFRQTEIVYGEAKVLGAHVCSFHLTCQLHAFSRVGSIAIGYPRWS